MILILGVFVPYWFCSGEPIGPRHEPGTGDGFGCRDEFAKVENSEVGRLEGILGRSRSSSGPNPSGGDPVSVIHSLRSELRDGFYSTHRNPVNRTLSLTERSAGHDGTRVAGSPTTSTTGSRTKSEAGNTTASAMDLAIYGAEDECVAANNGRPCVCFMTDFLELVGQRLEEEAAASADGSATPTVASVECPSYKAVPVAFSVTPAATPTTTAAGVETITVGVSKKKAAQIDGVLATASVWKRVDFDRVMNYQLEKSNDDHYVVHYCLVDSNVKIRCLQAKDVNSEGIITYKWDYKKSKHRSNSTITGTDTSNLLIWGLKPEDSKNYTCVPVTNAGENSNKASSYTHYVIAVEKPVYKIQGTAIYVSKVGGCASKMINPVEKQLPNVIRSQVCPEGSSRYACDVVVETPKCLEGKKALKFDYSITLNDDASYLTRIRSGGNTLMFQRLLAKISKVLAKNLNKTFTVQIKSKTSLISTYFEPDQSRMKVNNFVSCPPGFGIREVFCGACPPHHFNPKMSAVCQKCLKGYHQPAAGSETCVKCPNIFANGCTLTYQDEI